MRKEYSIKDLTVILGCSRTAIVKKIKSSSDNPGVKLYKNRYEVVTYNGQMAILLDDADLEREKSMSRGANNVLNGSDNTSGDSNIIDIEPEKDANNSNELYNFTKRYIEDFKTLQNHMYNEVFERDKQILLLTTSEEQRKNEYFKTSAENKMLKKRNTVLAVSLGVVTLVLVGFITFFATYITINNTFLTPKDSLQEKEEHVINEIKISNKSHAQK